MGADGGEREGDAMREVLDRELTESGEIQLQRRGKGIFEIIWNGVFLMASYNDRSEKILAQRAIENLLPKEDGFQILVGGLGMGFTLQAVLTCPGVSRAFVVEIERAVIDWNRRYFSDLNGGVLDDPRTVLIHADLFDFLHQVETGFDALLMDVDNGPNWLALKKNRRLYSETTLRRIKRILPSHGVLAVWSAQEDRGYWNKLNRVFPRTREIRIKETLPKEGESLIYLGMTRS